MPMTEHDFRALLADRSQDAASDGDLVSGVRRRIRQRQTRTRSALGAVAVAVIGVGALGAPPIVGRDKKTDATTVTINPSVTRSPEPSPSVSFLPTPTPTPTPTPSDATIPDYSAGAPAFAHGGKLLVGGVLHTPAHGELTVTFTPTSWDLTVAEWCPSSWPSDKVSFIVRKVNGHDMSAGTCGGAETLGDVTPGDTEAGWRNLGVRLGKPSTFSASIRQGPMTGRLPADQNSSLQAVGKRPQGTVTFGVYQRVIESDYPLPELPTTLAPPRALTDSRAPAATTVTGMNGTYAMSAVATADRNARSLVVERVAPGQIRVLVNGVLINVVESWEYTDNSAVIALDTGSLAHFGVRIKAGSVIHISFEATRFRAEKLWAAYQQEE